MLLSARAGLFVEALDYYERALDIHMELGCGEVHIATTRVLTGVVHFQLGEWNKALNLLQEALGCLLQELVEKHETVAATHLELSIRISSRGVSSVPRRRRPERGWTVRNASWCLSLEP